MAGFQSNNTTVNASFVNNSSLDTYIRSEDLSEEITIPLYVAIFLLSVIGNVLVIVTLVQNRRMRTVTNIFLLNLSLSDVLLAVFCMPFTLIPIYSRNFVFGATMCVMIRYFQGELSLYYRRIKTPRRSLTSHLEITIANISPIPDLMLSIVNVSCIVIQSLSGNRRKYSLQAIKSALSHQGLRSGKDPIANTEMASFHVPLDGSFSVLTLNWQLTAEKYDFI